MPTSAASISEASPLLILNKEQQQLDQNRKSVYTYAIIAAIGGFVCTYDTGSISSIVALPRFQQRFFINGSIEYYESILLASYLVTSMLGALSSGYFCDGIGRKHSMILAALLLSLGICCELLGYNATSLLLGRLIGGLGTGLMTNAIPLYQSEIAPPDIRGRLISTFSLLGSFGQMIGYFVTFKSSYVTSDWCWRTPWYIQLVLCLCFTIALLFLPQSPRWLISKARDQEGLCVLAKLHQSSQDSKLVRTEYMAIKTLIDSEEQRKENAGGESSYRELFVKKGGNLKRSIYSFFISVATCFAGNVIISYYAPQIFKNAGLNDVSISLALTGGIGVLSLIFSAMSLGWWIDIWGRKALFFCGSLISALCMMTTGFMFQFFYDTTSKSAPNNIYAQYTIIFFIYLFSASFASTWGVANYVYTAEIFSLQCRAKGLSVTYAISWACSILITYATPYFLVYSISGVYFFFGICSIVTLVGITFIPETKGKTLEEIDLMFESSSSFYS